MPYLLLGLLTAVATTARAKSLLESENGYRHALVSSVFSPGIWYEKCPGDKNAPEFVQRRELALSGIAGSVATTNHLAKTL
ncbi:hypothetical protein NXT3_PB00502 (plasmid) [Sinorhizobium fredii]|uniref:Uncharacterized protein n=1 Tax=Rhizobium fredii TaxID=380 RepID=A0A2L0HCD3_RHIFR|nr:hypothetical protein NXT3_PB00502 [Sinorhizobium fredii]